MSRTLFCDCAGRFIDVIRQIGDFFLTLVKLPPRLT